MTKLRPGFSTLNTQIPTVLWERLDAEAGSSGKSIARLLAEMLQKRYRVNADDLPQPRRPGRPKKRK